MLARSVRLFGNHFSWTSYFLISVLWICIEDCAVVRAQIEEGLKESSPIIANCLSGEHRSVSVSSSTTSVIQTTLKVPDRRYSTNIDCNISVTWPPGTALFIRFDLLDLSRSRQGCAGDFLRLNRRALCYTHNALDQLVFDPPPLSLTLKTSRYSQSNGYGLRAWLIAVPETVSLTEMCAEGRSGLPYTSAVADQASLVVSPQYRREIRRASNVLSYREDLDCTLYITVETGQKLEFEVIDLSLPGGCSDWLLLAGELSSCDGLDIGSKFNVSSNQAAARFVSDSVRQTDPIFTGFVFKYRAIGCRPSQLSSSTWTLSDIEEDFSASVECIFGHRFSDDSQTGRIECDGTNWILDRNFICEPVSCPIPDDLPDFVSLNFTSPIWRSRALVVCADNFSSSPGTPSSVECSSDGLWIGVKEVSCVYDCAKGDPLPFFAATNLTTTTSPTLPIILFTEGQLEGDVLRFGCLRGYHLLGPDAVLCVRGGWNRKPPSCALIVPDKPAEDVGPVAPPAPDPSIDDEDYGFGGRRKGGFHFKWVVVGAAGLVLIVITVIVVFVARKRHNFQSASPDYESSEDEPPPKPLNTVNNRSAVSPTAERSGRRGSDNYGSLLLPANVVAAANQDSRKSSLGGGGDEAEVGLIAWDAVDQDDSDLDGGEGESDRSKRTAVDSVDDSEYQLAYEQRVHQCIP